MDPITRLSLSLWYLLKSLPPVTADKLLAPAVFLCAWTVLSSAALPAPQAFVISAVVAQGLHLFKILAPVSGGGGARSGTGAGAQISSLSLRSLALVLAFFTLEVVMQSPRFVQGTVSFYAGVYAFVMLRASLRRSEELDPYCPQSRRYSVRDAVRQHICKLYALCALTVVAVNEATVAVQMPLGHRVLVLALLPMALHYVFAVMLDLTCPPVEAEDGQTDP